MSADQPVPCEECGCFQFGIFYDPTAQGKHVACKECGAVAHV